MKIGTVGTGFVVSDFINAATDVAGVEISAVYSRTAQKAEEFAAKHSVALKFCDREAFLTSGEFDFVYVASPNSLHFQWVKDALLAGKNVICEKPFVSAAAELAELKELAESKGLFLMEAVTVPHLPNFKLLREHLKEVGEIKMVQLNFSQYSSRYQAFIDGKNPNVFNTEFSGGALMDINFYNLYFTAMLFGRPENIKYYPNIREGIDTSGLLVMEYGGFFVSAVGCKDSKSENRVQIQGDKGYIVVPEESSRCVSFKVNANKAETEYNVQEHPNALYYELVDFEEIYRNRDFDAAKKLMENSMLVAELLEKARKEAGIIFAADKE